MVEIAVRNNDIEQAIRTLKRLITKEGIVKSIKDHEFHRSPSKKRKFKEKVALQRKRKKEQRSRRVLPR